MRVLRRLARLADQRLQFGNPRCHTLDHIVLREQKVVLLGFAQDMKRGRRHAQGESGIHMPRNLFLPTP